MKIKRETFLGFLQMVKPGLSQREFVEQSSCFVFDQRKVRNTKTSQVAEKGFVMTYNDEIACKKSIGTISLNGAVPAERLLEILEKMPDEFLRVEINPKTSEMEFHGKKRGFSVTREAKVVLPIDRVDKPGEWKPLPEGFNKGLERVKACVSSDETKFILTCVHFTPNFIQACDNRQLLRHKIQLDIEEEILVRGAAVSEIISLGMTDISITESWVHFRNESGLQFSCRKYVEPYPNLDEILAAKGKPIVIPRGLKDACERAGVFSADNTSGESWVWVTLSPGTLKILGKGVTGRYWERKSVDYNGPELSFIISPSLLQEIADLYSNATVTDNLLKVTGGTGDEGKWTYVARLGKLEDTEEVPDEPGEEESDDEADGEAESKPTTKKPKKK